MKKLAILPLLALLLSCQLNFEDIDVCVDPVLDPAPGVQREAFDLTITSATEGASIYYTLDGTPPTEDSTLYADSVRITHSSRILAVAVMAEHAPSNAVYGEYGVGWTVETFAGTPGRSGSADGTRTAASLSMPYGMATDGTSLYFMDGNAVRRVDIAGGAVTTIAGVTGTADFVDDVGTAARFNEPRGIAFAGTCLYVCDSKNNAIRRIDLATNAVTTFAGPLPPDRTPDWADGTGNAARFRTPNGLATDGTNLYVCDYENMVIRRIEISTRIVTTIAGTAGAAGVVDGNGASARFETPDGLAIAGASLYVTDNYPNTIRRIDLVTNDVTTIAGAAIQTFMGYMVGFADGIGIQARFTKPAGIASDGSNLYISDGNNTIRRMSIATGAVDTLGGSPFDTVPWVDGLGTATRFSAPSGLVWLESSLYVADNGNGLIRRMY